MKAIIMISDDKCPYDFEEKEIDTKELSDEQDWKDLDDAQRYRDLKS
jgi:hypothetical protein